MNRFVALAVTLVLTACAGKHRAETSPANAGGEPAASPLMLAISAQDEALSAAFNAHDLDALMALFAADLEFYHDEGGLQRYADVKRGFQGLFDQGNDIQRELVPGSLRVFPIRGYGAIELGSHRFCHTENGKKDCGTFEFVQVWHRLDQRWTITRVVSYGH